MDGVRALSKQEFKKKKHIKPRAMKIQNATKVAAYLKSEANKIHAAHPHA